MTWNKYMSIQSSIIICGGGGHARILFAAIWPRCHAATRPHIYNSEIVKPFKQLTFLENLLIFFCLCLFSSSNNLNLSESNNQSWIRQKHGGTLVCHLLLTGTTRVQIPASDDFSEQVIIRSYSFDVTI